ncbi:hypothetical protein H6P81_007225 [Aristolochia fimbriata]|uniref:Transmembrane protein n=1 Tax=Aristolochia fimbriata TaxID=158543 RepID=A0AAV7F397_ARIFI|nr:hypothetical protein H6P81_007225 [Aristolochia fimbriata]
MARVLLLCLLVAQAFACLLASTAEKHGSETGTSTIVEPPASSELLKEGKGTERGNIAQGPIVRRFGKHHHSVDKSVVGGGVILGGLATMILAAVFWYIRITRRQTEKPVSPV